MGLLDMLGAGLDDPRNIAALRMGGLISQGAIGQTRPTSLFGLLGQGAAAYQDTMRQARADEMERSKFGMLQDRAQREQEDYQRQLEQAAAQQRQMSEIGMRALALAGEDPAKRALALADPLEFIKSAQPAPKEIDRVIKTPEGQFGIAKDGSVVQAWPLEADLQNVNGVWVDRNRATSGSVAPQDVNALVTRGADGQPALNPLAFQARRQIAAAGAPQVNTYAPPDPTRALELEVKYRNDYESHPVTKAYKELQRQHRIISEAIKQGTPQGDIAAATAINKILDPTSTVRESELDAYLSAGGLLDKLQSYVQAVTTGQKLTPAQRKNLQSLADEVFNASKELAAANALDTRKVIEGRSNVGLDVDRIAPGPWTFYGYKTQEDAVRDAKNTIMRNPQSRAQVIQRLESIGIVDHGLRNQ